ncbi:hypothetical protein HYH03_015793 [Edaphochlamys debaryana]|uniref:Uncharacterized protein n=1 Tax=Edaphochlamys debaryana TaxID=47281 RepID=A0A835XKI7_9CHLO|nr:hypothetical protein HYH03_015793 [Edaphochlamys debaryana]|eukprot:KAG2485521.1 hypothetical protein HYH03_015793 [Edaphochlamys debaryana]
MAVETRRDTSEDGAAAKAGRSAPGGASSSGRPAAPAPAPGRTARRSSSTSGGRAAPYRYLLLSGNESVLMQEALERRPWWEPAGPSDGDRWNMWCGLNGQVFRKYDLLPPSSSASTSAPSSRRLVNRLEAHGRICTKNGLAGLLQALRRAVEAQAQAKGGGGGGGPPLDTSWMPETHVLPAGPKAAAAGGSAMAAFRAAYEQHAAAGRRVWICKPTSLNRGNGITVCDSLEGVTEHLATRPEGSSLIVQKYIERPLLLGGRKFDIRAYALVGPDGRVYFHREAYVRTSSTPYDPSDLANRSAHLTNDAVQKHLASYHAFEDHCKLSLEQLGPALRGAPGGAEAPDLDTRPGCEEGVWGAMRRCVAALFSAAAPLMNPRKLAHCWELLGLDFMLGAEGGLALIEVNTSPALFRAGAYLTDLLPRLVEEVAQRVLDPLFPPPPGQAQQGTAPAAPLEGFVQVPLDTGLGAAAAAALGHRTGAKAAASKAVPPPAAAPRAGGRAMPVAKVEAPRAVRAAAAAGPGGASPPRLRVQRLSKPAAPLLAAPGGPPASLPSITIKLHSQGELQAALLALKQGYTGAVDAADVRQALEARAVGLRLGMEGVPAASDARVMELLGEPADEPAVLQLYTCQHLWPTGDASFAAVLDHAKPRLVEHFGDTLSALNTPSLHRRLLQLPAAGLEVLLEADAFGTDSEDTVLALLAVWMDANWARTDVATRGRLCSLVRLVQVSTPALSSTLPALAADYEAKGETDRAGWFAIKRDNVFRIIAFAGASEQQRKSMVMGEAGEFWLNPRPRRQCVPEGGIQYDWSIPPEHLRSQLAARKPGSPLGIWASLGHGSTSFVAHGHQRLVLVQVQRDGEVAGVFHFTELLSAFQAPGLSLSPGGAGAGLLPISAGLTRRLTVHRWNGPNPESDLNHTTDCRGGVTDEGWGCPTMLPLSKPPLGSGGPLGPWASYLGPDGRLTGSITLLPHK